MPLFFWIWAIPTGAITLTYACWDFIPGCLGDAHVVVQAGPDRIKAIGPSHDDGDCSSPSCWIDEWKER